MALDTHAQRVSRFLVFWRRFTNQRLAVGALGFLIAMMLVAVFAPWVATHDPSSGDLLSIFKSPDSSHWLGTDDLGRDLFSRMVYGTRVSLSAAFQATAIAAVAGLPLGLVAGYFGGWIESVANRLSDAVMTFPALILAVIIVGILGPSLSNAMIAIGVVYAPRLFRIARAGAIAVKNETYISASRTIGCSGLRIVIRHVLPNVLSPIIVQLSISMGTAILAEASLSFLGLGVQPPQSSWGSILGRSVATMNVQPLGVIISGILISLTVLAFNLVGDAMRDAVGRRGATE